MSEENMMRVGVDKIDFSNIFVDWNKFQCIMLSDIVIVGYAEYGDGTYKVVNFTQVGKPYLPPEDCFWFVKTEAEAQESCLKVLKGIVTRINQGNNK